jgi:hypothetical protein
MDWVIFKRWKRVIHLLCFLSVLKKKQYDFLNKIASTDSLLSIYDTITFQFWYGIEVTCMGALNGEKFSLWLIMLPSSLSISSLYHFVIMQFNKFLFNRTDIKYILSSINKVIYYIWTKFTHNGDGMSIWEKKFPLIRAYLDTVGIWRDNVEEMEKLRSWERPSNPFTLNAC